MRKALTRWAVILAAILICVSVLAYWGYATITDQYLEASFGDLLDSPGTLAAAPEVERAFRAGFLPPRHNRPEGRLALEALRDFHGRVAHHHLLALLIAQRLRQRYSQPERMALYAHTVYLGEVRHHRVFGVRNAALVYFGKDPERLSLGEAAWLAALAERPSFSAHPDRAREKRDQIIDRMAEARLITADEASNAKRQPAPAGN
jgi:hypothetical protein